MTTPAPGPGLFASLRRLFGTGVGIALVRLQIFGSELEAEKLRLFDVLWRVALALLLAGLALVMLLAFVVLAVQEAWRLPVIAALALLLGGAAVMLLVRARALLSSPEGGPFALTLAELRRDRDGLAPPEP